MGNSTGGNMKAVLVGAVLAGAALVGFLAWKQTSGDPDVTLEKPASSREQAASQAAPENAPAMKEPAAEENVGATTSATGENASSAAADTADGQVAEAGLSADPSPVAEPETAETSDTSAVAGMDKVVGFDPAYDVVLGSPDAPVTIVEYASLTCSHCAAFHEGTFQELKTRYIDTGKVKFVLRDFPFDRPGFLGAIIARCKGPEYYTGFVDVLFRTVKQWAYAGDAAVELKKIARLRGISEEGFDACLADKELQQKIVERRQVAMDRFKIESTPSFVLDGEEVFSGNLPIEMFAEKIDARLK